MFFNNSISTHLLSLERELCLALSSAVKPLFMGFAALFIFCQVVSGFVVFYGVVKSVVYSYLQNPERNPIDAENEKPATKKDL